MTSDTLGKLIRRPESGAFLGLVAVLVFFVLFGSTRFLQPAGAASWLNVAANLGIIALPVGLLMIAGELDISVGALVPAGSMTVAIISGYWGLPIWLGIGTALGIGLLVGYINGTLLNRTGLPSLIITLGTLFTMQGFVLGLSVIFTGTVSVQLKAEQSGAVAKFLFGQFLGGTFQIIIIWWLLLTAGFYVFAHMTKYGNWIFAMGGDRESARNAGIPTNRMTVVLYMLSGISCTFVGACQAILFNSAQVSSGMTFIFNSIISVVVGGVLLTGGFGSVIGIFFGTITFAIVNQGIYFTDFDRNWSSAIIGIMLLAAVLLNNNFRKMALSASTGKK